MSRLIMLKGLPASGKSTWAKERVLASNGRVKRINKDDLRALLDDSIWSKQNEKNILAVRDLIVKHYLSNDFEVIVDDTNLSPNHEETLRRLADESGAKFEIESFLDIPLATCILRNAQRPNPVPEKAIRSMFNAFLRREQPTVDPPPFIDGAPSAVICDIDGTLADMTKRRQKFGKEAPFVWKEVGMDDVVPQVASLLERFRSAPDVKILLVSGRDGVCRRETEEWLYKHGIQYDELFMRPAGNTERDVLIKQRIYEEHIRGKYNIEFVLDDRDQVVKMWRSNGLKCFQVAEGDF